ncbi:MAG: sulfur carrier protein ThiS [Candidatus Krumholzibacteria bacterium]|nr:sulfur carrier protein ThiS [Candidatus Krumholzibacteria bacterium]MDH4338070.1 sulfur carrier protein ThiS [Candidatus Krumholzibacteria bacterium]MDH5270294.1 sulfur carrier protein ThiS [Candidatus Krumholzibacteria bacterium]
MRIKLNGTDTDVQPGTALVALLERFDIKPDTDGIAVAVNETVVPRRAWQTHTLENGDVVEIIRAVQGG